MLEYIQTEKEFLDVLEAKGSKGAKIQRLSSGYGLSESVCTIHVCCPYNFTKLRHRRLP
jgi:hypothetical protein